MNELAQWLFIALVGFAVLLIFASREPPAR